MATFIPEGVCSSEIVFEVEEGIVTKCRFTDGCDGNLEGMARLVVNRPVEEVILLLEGIQCRNGTSCPDQLAQALKKYIKDQT